jgi:hypothetical protein
LGLLLGLAQGRQQHRRKNGNDRYYHQQLNQSKTGGTKLVAAIPMISGHSASRNHDFHILPISSHDNFSSAIYRVSTP